MMLNFAVAYILTGQRVLRFTSPSEMKRAYAFPKVAQCV